ncbi:GNAT family N-acetyltransferase [Streptomyces sp. NPDC001185]|uniref:GNAT family N-acetyltransferase n=1 Tax=Streptomyces sp. NPDC001185 TaxID=3154380 RepID=UPI00331BF056
MRFRWEWLEPMMPVPYVPTLGPVHPASPLLDLFNAVVEAAGTDRFLPHDKDRRWSDRKTEQVLANAIQHHPRQTLVPTLIDRGARTVRVHAYTSDPQDLADASDFARQLARVHGAVRARVVSFLAPGQPQELPQGGIRVRIRDFTAGPGPAPGLPVHEFHRLPPGAGFGEFAEAMTADGFAFLHERMRAAKTGPVLTMVHEGLVAAAIGPMETMPDAAGAVRLLPQYFGVLPPYRGRGYGRALWRAAMHWGHEHGADYQILQTQVGGPSDSLCAAEGLTSLGVILQAEVLTGEP